MYCLYSTRHRHTVTMHCLYSTGHRRTVTKYFPTAPDTDVMSPCTVCTAPDTDVLSPCTVCTAPDTDVVTTCCLHRESPRTDMRGLTISSADHRQTSSWVSALSTVQRTKHREISVQLRGHLQIGHIFVVNLTRHSKHRMLRIYIKNFSFCPHSPCVCVSVFTERQERS